jgi:hypothetical protein
LAFFFCHPEPGPELNSGSNDLGISVLGLENLGFKAPPCGRGNLLSPIKATESFTNDIQVEKRMIIFFNPSISRRQSRRDERP